MRCRGCWARAGGVELIGENIHRAPMANAEASIRWHSLAQQRLKKQSGVTYKAGVMNRRSAFRINDRIRLLQGFMASTNFASLSRTSDDNPVTVNNCAPDSVRSTRRTEPLFALTMIRPPGASDAVPSIP